MEKHSTSKDLLKVMGMVLLFVTAFLLHVAVRTTLVSEGYELERLRVEGQKLEAKVYSLKAEKNALMGPKGLEKKVKLLEERGISFKNPPSEHVIFVQLEGSP